ncbi:hypothetical protein [Roseibium sp. MMSF_3544]|uniref:hypothetical protein n=1 Tax=unclassified Roseibium TaxID=2629323 RepID=UPI0027401337|nr:hypothetical protein [Roseibium sp. MMSF_3544]
MIVSKTTSENLQLDTELCRAMFEKDPDKMIELLSDWMEMNGLTPSEDFCIPPYLHQVLSGTTGCTKIPRSLRIYAS